MVGVRIALRKNPIALAMVELAVKAFRRWPVGLTVWLVAEVGFWVVAAWLHLSVLIPVLLPFLVVALVPAVREQIWVAHYRTMLAKESLPFPGMRRARRFRKQEASRRREVTSQLPRLAASHGWVNGDKISPAPRKMRSDPLGSVIFLLSPGPLAVKGGVGKLQTLAPALAEVVGAERCVVEPTSPGRCRVTVMWENPIGDRLPIQLLPESGPDEVSLGKMITGAVARIAMGMHVLLCAQTGYGKSSTLWAIITGVNMKVDSRLWVIDPKGGQELGALEELVGCRVGRMSVVGYCDSVKKADGKLTKIIRDIEAALVERQAALKARGIRKWSASQHGAEFPLLLVVFDELLETIRKMDAATRDALETKLLSQGRAAGLWVIGLSQMPTKDVLGDARDLIPVTIVLGTRSPIQTGVAFGNMSAEAEGAECSRLSQPGLAYMEVSERGFSKGYQLVRIAHVDDPDIEAICETGLPKGMGKDTTQISPWSPAWNYRYFTDDGQLLYTGITSDWDKRDRQHWDGYKAGDPKHYWMRWVTRMQPPLVTPAPDRATAKLWETIEIKTYRPLGNRMENEGNPWQGWPPANYPGFIPGSRAKLAGMRGGVLRLTGRHMSDPTAEPAKPTNVPALEPVPQVYPGTMPAVRSAGSPGTPVDLDVLEQAERQPAMFDPHLDGDRVA